MRKLVLMNGVTNDDAYEAAGEMAMFCIDVASTMTTSTSLGRAFLGTSHFVFEIAKMIRENNFDILDDVLDEFIDNAGRFEEDKEAGKVLAKICIFTLNQRFSETAFFRTKCGNMAIEVFRIVLDIL